MVIRAGSMRAPELDSSLSAGSGTDLLTIFRQNSGDTFYTPYQLSVSEFFATYGLDSTELGFLNGVTAGTGAASKALVLDSNGNVVMPANGQFEFSNATPAAAGTTAADATALAAQVNAVTGADGAKGVALPAAADNLAIYVHNTSLTGALKVYPVNGGNDNINGLAEDAAYTMRPGQACWFVATSATQWYAPEPGGVVYRNTAASAAHTNTTDEALFDTTYTIKANTLKAGSVIKIRYQGIATATNSTDTLTIKLYIGGLAGTALLTGTATDVADNDIFAGEFELIIRTAGGSGTMVGVGTHTEVPAASGTAVQDITEILASTTIDTTADQVIGVGADWSVADPGNSARLDFLRVEIWG